MNDEAPPDPDEIELCIASVAADPAGACQYFVQLLDRPAQSDSQRQIPAHSVPLTLPVDDLSDAGDNVLEYGKLLGAAVFADPDIAGAIWSAMGRAGKDGLRFRLFCDDDAIQKLRWETLCFKDHPLFTDNVCLSRYLSPDKLTPRPVMRPSLKSLIFIASPNGLANTGNSDDPAFKRGLPPDRQPKLAAIDVTKERETAEKYLTGQSTDGAVALTTEFLGSREDGSPGDGSLAKLMAKLDEGFDILYIVCHGAFNFGDPCLYLENEAGVVEPVHAGAIVASIAAMSTLAPRLVILASCQSAGAGDTVASKMLTALGPAIARAGVPAVIAMQGFVTIRTAEAFMGKLFAEIRRHGQVDRAVAAARTYCCSITRPDYWMPVLFSSSRSGAIFQPYQAGFRNTGKEPPWQTITQRTKAGTCVPVLGPDCLEPIWGATRDIASSLAAACQFPLEEHLSESLPAVAQFIKLSLDASQVDQALIDYLARVRPAAPAGAKVWDQLAAIGRERRTSQVEDLHKLLAVLPYPIYLTASPDHLLEDALTEAGRPPKSDFARWNHQVQDKAKYPRLDDQYRPNVQEPLVYHLFGDYTKRRSMVVTEDDYTDYMLGINTPEAANFTPTFIKSALAGNALLFLGFHFKHPGFEIVLRNTLRWIQEDEDDDKKLWVGAQLPPDKDRYRRVQAARIFIENTIGSSLKIYWGSTQDFVEEFGRNARRDLPECFRSASTAAGVAR